MSIELNDYGFQIDTSFFYVALSWGFIVTMSVLGATLWAYKKWSNRK
jgi:hypothetical protein